MKIKSWLAREISSYSFFLTRKEYTHALSHQEMIRKSLVGRAAKTVFGREHHFADIQNYADYREAIPLREYEDFRPYINDIMKGGRNILWPGRPIYFAETSGTTSGVKFIPISKESISNHINTAREALLCYIARTGNADFVSRKMIFLSGSPHLESEGGVPTGRLSGIVNHHIPSYLRTSQLPSYETNCIDDWEPKLDQIVDETLCADMGLISGIPPWMQMYFDRLYEKTGKKVGELFPNFSVMPQGGVNFEPYKEKMFESIGRNVDWFELYPSSEGFLAFQDASHEEGLLLNTNRGIFFEFIAESEIGLPNPRRCSLCEVEIGKNYAVILSTNAGLWAYSLGDMVRFVSIAPYRIVVSGRVRHFISAFGEHVIGEEVEYALMNAANAEGVRITEFTVAPYVSKTAGKSFHEWYIEFENEPADLDDFALSVDNGLRSRNVYYDDLIKGNILSRLHIKTVRKNGFIDYMRSIGKLGGQNKVPRLSNDRKLADGLELYLA